MSFKVKKSAANKTGSLPAHWDIFIDGNEDSLITVWDSEEMAKLVVKGLREYAKKKEREKE